MGITNSAAEQAEKQKMMKPSKKTHLRSLTSHKGTEADAVSHGQRNNGRRQPSAGGVTGKGNRQENGEGTGEMNTGKSGNQVTALTDENPADANHEGKFIPAQPATQK